MKESINVWGIKEFEGDGIRCPVVPAKPPWYKKAALTFFRFGVCPACVTLSLTYSLGKAFRRLYEKNERTKTG